MNSTQPVVLVVDDHPENVALVVTNLELEGYGVVTAVDGAEAIRKVLELHPDVVLLDVMMPVMDGLEACRQLRRNPETKDTPIIMLTAKGRVEDVVEGMESGADDYLKKPFHIVELLARVKVALRLKSSRDELVALSQSLDERVEERTRELQESHKELQAAQGSLKASNHILQRTNEQLRQSIDRANRLALLAEALTQTKSEFLANMSHEIRTPMTAILGYADEVADGCRRTCDFGGEQCPEHMAIIVRNGQHLLHLINDILDLSKIEAGKLEVEHIRRSPVQILSEVQSLMRVRADAKNLPLDIEYVGPIPETIESDPMRLSQILVNLLSNAIKFTETGAIRIVTRLVDREQDNPVMRFDVIDTGIGMTEKQVGNLFQPFTQADGSTTRKFGGTGLGLCISERLAKILDGNITVESKLGEGSTFRLTIAAGPLDGVKMLDNPADATTANPESGIEATHDGQILDCRILLAEDGVDNQRLIVRILKKVGAEVTVVDNGELAANAALAAREEGNPFDVVLMDMQMPIMDGYEATGLLRQKGYTAPIIALTAHAMASDREKCIEAGCDDYATKPIDLKQLIDTIRKWRQKRPILVKERASQTATHEEADAFVP